uniref:Uncharacterized protein n=1 Tax=Rhabditophanes sp. KR3021 TaxID=114890 RepID=A0AC35UF49_9BILA
MDGGVLEDCGDGVVVMDECSDAVMEDCGVVINDSKDVIGEIKEKCQIKMSRICQLLPSDYLYFTPEYAKFRSPFARHLRYFYPGHNKVVRSKEFYSEPIKCTTAMIRLYLKKATNLSTFTLKYDWPYAKNLIAILVRRLTDDATIMNTVIKENFDHSNILKIELEPIFDPVDYIKEQLAKDNKEDF